MSDAERDPANHLPYMPWYPGDYLSDTLELSVVEDCLYRRMLDAYWLSGGKLSADLERLRRAVRFDRDEFAACWPAVRRHWYEADGVLHNKRVRCELDKARGLYRAKQARAAAIAATKAKKKATTGDAPRTPGTPDDHTMNSSRAPEEHLVNSSRVHDEFIMNSSCGHHDDRSRSRYLINKYSRASLSTGLSTGLSTDLSTNGQNRGPPAPGAQLGELPGFSAWWVILQTERGFDRALAWWVSNAMEPHSDTVIDRTRLAMGKGLDFETEGATTPAGFLEHIADA